jgi:cytochrome c oxidase subunit 3
MAQSAVAVPQTWLDREGIPSEPAPEVSSTRRRKALVAARPFETVDNQFAAGKLGTWVFLGSDVLFFSGLFSAYIVCRSAHPEVFQCGRYFLDTSLGTLESCLLIASSFVAAMAVRAAQQGASRKLVANIAMTLVFGVLFLVARGFEYADKVESGLLPGTHFDPRAQVWELDAFRRLHPEAADYARLLRAQTGEPAGAPTLPSASGVELPVEPSAGEPTPDTKQIEPLLAAGIVGPASEHGAFPSLPHNAHQFFGVYFLLTGVHGLHVLVGIGLWTWLLLRAGTGEFGERYFGPVYHAGLYWQFVNLIWIYLFPLLYLIH